MRLQNKAPVESKNFEEESEPEEERLIESKNTTTTTTQPKAKATKRKITPKSQPEQQINADDADGGDDDDADVKTKSLIKKANPRSKKKPAAGELNNEQCESTAIDEGINGGDDLAIDYELNEKELISINGAFDLNCPNQKEAEELASENLKTALRSLGYEPRAEEIRSLMKRFSTNKRRQTINRDAFHRIMAFKYSTSAAHNPNSKWNASNANDEITKVFNLFDLDRTGKISLENLKLVATELNESLTNDDLVEMIAEADQDGDSLVDKIEFENIMKKTSLY